MLSDFELGAVIAFYSVFGFLASFSIFVPVLMLCKLNCPTTVLYAECHT
jgi:hypothetical protein